MRPDLTVAVENLYRVFARFPLIEDVSYCEDHCVTAAEVAALHRTPLREVTHDQMRRLVGNTGTWGDDLYFYHFAPRYLELASLPDGEEMWMNSRLHSIWLDGPPEGRVAVDEFMRVWWLQVASTRPDRDRFSAMDMLEVFSDCDRRCDTYVTAWPAGVHADLQLAATVRDLYRRCEPDNEFWRDVNAWLVGPMPLARLNAALADACANGLRDEDIVLLTEVRDCHLGALKHWGFYEA